MKSFDEWVDDMSLENEDNDIVEFTEKCFADALVRLGISEDNEEKGFNSGFDVENAVLFRYFQGPKEDSSQLDGDAIFEVPLRYSTGDITTNPSEQSIGLTEEALEQAIEQIRDFSYNSDYLQSCGWQCSGVNNPSITDNCKVYSSINSDAKTPRHYYQYSQGKRSMVAVISQEVKDEIIKEYKRELLEFSLINDCDEVIMKILGFNTIDDYFASAKHLTLDNMIEKWLEENE